MPNPARVVSAEELELMPKDGFRYELVRGRLIRMSPVAPRHGDVTMALGSLLWQHVRANRLGRVWTEVGFRLFSNPDTVLAPDVAFVRADRLPPRDAKGFYRGAPELAIEVAHRVELSRSVHAPHARPRLPAIRRRRRSSAPVSVWTRRRL